MPDPRQPDRDDDLLDGLDDEAVPLDPPRRIRIDAALTGYRLDRALATALPAVSRSRIQQWIGAGAVRLNGALPRPREEVFEGDLVDLDPPPAPEVLSFHPQSMRLDIVYEDESLLVLDKPPGLVVHPAAGNWSGTLLNGLLAHEPALAALPRAGIVHRLDADTSGLMVVARNMAAHTDLVRQLQARSVMREYWALVFGRPSAAPVAGGTIDAPIGRDPRHPLRFKVSHAPSARAARTHYRCVDEVVVDQVHVRWLACRLDTGRTHQIRVHLESIGQPLVGDPVYRQGRPALRADQDSAGVLARFPRQALHACRLQLVHPAQHTSMGWFRAPADDMLGLMLEIGFRNVDRPHEAFA
jgi:23S rRNA pseudouridine1911/1915/1917 synthase